MTQATRPHLGILDWGIGGIGLWQLIKQSQPNLAITYWSDAGCTPYGKMTSAALQKRVTAVAAAMGQMGVTHLAIACNAASTILPLCSDSLVLPAVTGVIAHGIVAVEQWHRQQPRKKPLSVGIVGGRRTIASGAYRGGLAHLSKCIVHQRIAQPISRLIESGQLRSLQMSVTLDRITKPLAHVDALVLACTHYPAIADQFALRCPQAVIIDPAQHMWTWMHQHWPLGIARGGIDRFVTTGNISEMQRGARTAFRVRLPARLMTTTSV
jgi:glutamate racemase